MIFSQFMTLKECILCGGKLKTNLNQGIVCPNNKVELYISYNYIRIDLNPQEYVRIYSDSIFYHNSNLCETLPIFDFNIHDIESLKSKINTYLNFR